MPRSFNRPWMAHTTRCDCVSLQFECNLFYRLRNALDGGQAAQVIGNIKTHLAEMLSNFQFSEVRQTPVMVPQGWVAVLDNGATEDVKWIHSKDGPAGCKHRCRLPAPRTWFTGERRGAMVWQERRSRRSSGRHCCYQTNSVLCSRCHPADEIGITQQIDQPDLLLLLFCEPLTRLLLLPSSCGRRGPSAVTLLRSRTDHIKPSACL